MQQLFINCLVAIAALYKFTADVMFIFLLLILCCCQQNELHLLYLWVFVWYGKNALFDVSYPQRHFHQIVPLKLFGSAKNTNPKLN